MNKPDFTQMTRRELKRYLTTHRTDEEAWEEFANCPKLDSKRYPAPSDEIEVRIMEQALRERLDLPETEWSFLDFRLLNRQQQLRGSLPSGSLLNTQVEQLW